MPVAPTPPTKPSPPVAPAVTLPNANTAGKPPTTAADSSPQPGKTVSPAATGTARELEGLGKALPGNSTPPKADARNITTPARPLAAEAGVAARTTVPAQPPLPERKPAGYSYVPFVAVVVVIAVILCGLRLFKHKKEQQRTVVDYSQHTTAVMNQDGLDIVVSPQTTAPKVKQNFEFRV
ncbi:hypothetical protein SPTER_31810 [Sporomusa termitida]|uniref:Uncharacterized protein n=2 Tax=Sporomusa termitida TaxID=2377 RepID=A0A517DWP0_9FIRM|nr:hypothetical protein SPTER_31810 [Sporomusa termitida]